jgi:hypothetical protein
MAQLELQLTEPGPFGDARKAPYVEVVGLLHSTLLHARDTVDPNRPVLLKLPVWFAQLVGLVEYKIDAPGVEVLPAPSALLLELMKEREAAGDLL